MRKDLTLFERNLLKTINIANHTNYNYKHLMEWNSNKSTVEANLQEGETVHKALGCYVAIKEET